MKCLNFSSNKGMYLETLVNKTIDFYIHNKICWFRKQNMFIAPKSVNQTKVTGKLCCKNDVDFYGIYKGVFVCFEAKQTISHRFYLNNIKEHQWEFLKTIFQYNGISFLILSFLKTNEFYAINFKNLEMLQQQGFKSLTIKELQEYGFHLEIRLPGILDLISFFNIEYNKFIS